jgi:hypothetical protein
MFRHSLLLVSPSFFFKSLKHSVSLKTKFISKIDYSVQSNFTLTLVDRENEKLNLTKNKTFYVKFKENGAVPVYTNFPPSSYAGPKLLRN